MSSPVDSMRAIWEKQRPNVLERVNLLEHAARALDAGELAEPLRGEAWRAAHMLAGAVGTFGFADASLAARELEAKLADPSLADPREISQLVVAVRRDLEGEPFTPGEFLPAVDESALPVPVPEGEGLRVLLVDDEEDYCERIAVEAEALGIDLDTALTPQQARSVCASRRPALVLLDLIFPEDGTAGAYGLLAELTSAEPAIPVLVLTGIDAFTDRVQAARLGARGFLPKSLAPAAVLEAASRFLARGRLTSTRVLLVDDDPAMLETMRSILESNDLEVSTLADPMRFWETLEEVVPELLILDLDMPGANGLELCRVVRNDPRWSDLAVIFVTAATDPAKVQEMYQAGADDYVAKPIAGPELITRVTNRLDRIRLYRARAETDSLTGLANRRKASEGLAQLISLAGRFSQPVTVAMLDLDHFKQVNDHHGHAAGDEVLRRFGESLRRDFRGNDVVGRWGGEEFIVGMYGMSTGDAVRRLTGTLERFGAESFQGPDREFNVTFSAGVAGYERDVGDLSSVCDAADEALYRAKAAGRACILASESDSHTERYDVVCVEDDEVLAEVLVSSLTDRGYAVKHFSDGEQARAAFCDDPPALRARVVLLDVDLPGLDGYSLLGELERHGVLRFSRVIMLTAHASEQETLKALDLGACDHIAKPFSLPILMKRIQQNLLEA